MDYLLNNKTAFVTGSTSGIGFAIAKLLARERANVILNGRHDETIANAIEELKKEILPQSCPE